MLVAPFGVFGKKQVRKYPGVYAICEIFPGKHRNLLTQISLRFLLVQFDFVKFCECLLVISCEECSMDKSKEVGSAHVIHLVADEFLLSVTGNRTPYRNTAVTSD